MDKVTIKNCSVTELQHSSEFAELITEYDKEASINGLPPHSAQWDMYRTLETAGAISVLVAFLDLKLIGFVVVLSHVMPHYGAGISTTESFFVAKDYRKTGAGSKLLNVAEHCAEERGSAGLLISTPYGGKLEAVLMKNKNYNPSNTVFFRKLNNV